MQIQMIFQRVRSLCADIQTNGVSDSDMVDLFNQVQANAWQFVEKTNPDVFTETQQRVGYINGTQEYIPGSGFDRIIGIEVTDLGTPLRPLVEVPYDQKDEYDVHGEPVAYYVIGGTIGFLPIPDRTASNNVLITYVPNIIPVTYDSGGAYKTVVPGLPVQLHDMLCYELAALLRERDQLPVDYFLAKATESKYNYLLNAAHGAGSGRTYITWIP